MMAVIIRLQNLPLSASASSIRTFFQGLKIPDGGVNIVGGEEGDAFIAFATDDDARQAMLLNGEKINGVIIKLLLSSKQEMQKIITDAQNGVLKRNAPLPIVESINQNDKRSITYYNPDPSQARNNTDMPPSAKMRVIDHSANVYSNGDSVINNNKENNLFNEPPRPSEFSYRIARPVVATIPSKDEQLTYRYDTPEYSELTTNINSRSIVYEENQQPFHNNINQEAHIENNFNTNIQYYDEQPSNKFFVPTPRFNVREKLEMNDMPNRMIFEKQLIPIRDRERNMSQIQSEEIQHIQDNDRTAISFYNNAPMLPFDKPEGLIYERSEIPIFDEPDMKRFDSPERNSFDRTNMQTFDRSETFHFDKPENSHYDRTENPCFDRLENPRFDRPENPHFDRPENPRFDRPENPRFDRPENPRFDRPENPRFDRPENPRFDRPENSRFDRPENPRFDRPETHRFNRPELSNFDKPEMQHYDRQECIDRQEMQRFDRQEIHRFERPEMTRFDRPERQRFDKSEMSTHERPEFLRLQKSRTPMFDRPDIPVFNVKPEIEVYNRQEIPRVERSEMDIFDRQDRIHSENRENMNRERRQVHDRLSMRDRPHIHDQDRLRKPINSGSLLDDPKISILDRVQFPDRHPPVGYDRMQILRQDPKVPPIQHHDYTERPQWLEGSKTEVVPPSGNSVVRASLPPSIINAKTVFELFRNIQVVPKRGIRIEQDAEKRLTGYVYVQFMNDIEANKALKLNNKVFRGIVITIESVSEEDFMNVNVKSEEESLNNENIEKGRSPYYRDFCLEILNIPLDVTESELKDYLDISINNKNMHFLPQSDSGYCLITANDADMMDKILKFNGITFRGSALKIVAISKFQLQTLLASKAREVKRSKPILPTSKPALPASKPALPAPKPALPAPKSVDISKGVITCVKFEKLTENMKAIDIKQLLNPVSVMLPNIIMNKTECIVNLQSASNYLKVINHLKSRPEIKFVVTPISTSEFQSLKTAYLNNSGGQKSDANVKNDSTIKTTKPDQPSPSSSVRIKNFPNTITTAQIKNLIRNFESQPVTTRICYEKGRNIGEAILTFRDSTEAVDFKDEFHGMWFIQKKLEVLLTEK